MKQIIVYDSSINIESQFDYVQEVIHGYGCMPTEPNRINMTDNEKLFKITITIEEAYPNPHVELSNAQCK